MTRTCGPCQACCTRLEVKSLGKPQDVACVHLTATGCAIYETRPTDCREFVCLWLVDPTQRTLRDADRPDLLGVLFAPISKTLAGALELRPGALRSGRTTCNRLSRRLPVVPCPVGAPKT